MAPIPSLLAMAAVHKQLVRDKTRTQVALIIESGEPREGDALRVADRIRRERDQPVSGVRDAARHEAARDARGRRNGEYAEKNFIKAITRAC